MLDVEPTRRSKRATYRVDAQRGAVQNTEDAVGERGHAQCVHILTHHFFNELLNVCGSDVSARRSAMGRRRH
jgi:hypothetical protein